VNGTEIFTVLAALGKRELHWSGEWAVRPDVPSHADSTPRELPPHQVGTIGERLEMRLANARAFEQLDGVAAEDGRSAIWVRLPDELDASASTLAIVGDYVPFGISQAGGQRARSNSLDNTIRVVRMHPTRWVLADIRVQAVAAGFGHGVVHLWAEDGTLLATASQSAIVREWRDE
jgi:acyl-CoA thioesterase